ncbi:MAG TPA: hypothetical protein VFG06_11005 [Thermodesulfovibrionales bacterium]|nr:hypothetical protein [Thermodesulfovibrionales bacterium]
MPIIITNEQYNSGFMIEEYNGVYSLVNAYMSKDGEEKMKWAYIEKSVKDEDTGRWEGSPGKKIPWKIELGPRDQAIDNLKKALRELVGSPDGPEQLPDTDGPAPDASEFSDIPF